MERQHAWLLQQVALQRSWLTWLWRAFLDFGILLCTGISCCDAKEALFTGIFRGQPSSSTAELDAKGGCMECVLHLQRQGGLVIEARSDLCWRRLGGLPGGVWARLNNPAT